MNINALKIGTNLEVTQNVIQQFNNSNADIVVISLIGKNIKLVEKSYQELTKQQLKQNGLTLNCIDQFAIFTLASDALNSVVLHLLYNISAYIYFVCENEQELDDILKYFQKIPQGFWKKCYNHSPKVNEKQLKIPIFRSTKKFLILKGKPKLIQTFPMKAMMLLNLMLNYCDYYNSNKSTMDERAFLNVYENELQCKLNAIQQQYREGLIPLTQLVEADELDLRQRDLIQQAVRGMELQKSQQDLIIGFFEEYEKMVVQNSINSKEFCNQLMNSYLQLFSEESANIEDLIQQKEIYIKQKGGEFEEILDAYLKEAIGQFKYRAVIESVPQLLFQQFDKWFEAINAHYIFQLNRNQAQLLQTMENLAELQNRLSDVESKKFELENVNQSLFFDLESSKREVEKLNKLKELQEELSERQLQELKQKHEKTKEKKNEYKEKCEICKEENRRLHMELTEKKKELVNNLMKIQHLDNALTQNCSQKDTITALQKELSQLMSQFRENLIYADNQRVSVANSDISRNTITDKYQLKQLDKISQKYDKSKERCKQLESQLNTISMQLEESTKVIMDGESKIKKLEIEIEALKTQEPQNQVKKDEQWRLALINKQNEEFMKVLMHHKEQIEKENEKNTKLQDLYYEKSMKLSEMSYQKDNLLTILRETLKMMHNKQNTLQIILKSMVPELQQEIKDIFVQTGVKL